MNRISVRITESDLESVEDNTLGWSDYQRDEEQKQTDYENGRLAEIALAKLFGREGIRHQLLGGQGEADLTANGVNIDVKARNCDTQRNLIVNEGQKVNEIIDLYVLGIVHRDIDGQPVAVEFVGYITSDKHEQKKRPVQMNRQGRVEDVCDKSEVKNYELDAMGDLVRFLGERQQLQQQPVTAD